MNPKQLYLWIGIFLLLDGVLSLYWGKSCTGTCANNSDFGNLIRIIRTIGGAILVYFNK